MAKSMKNVDRTKTDKTEVLETTFSAESDIFDDFGGHRDVHSERLGEDF